ncbi:PREDICTED: transmembrane protein 184C [Papilio xuthus]|uniref:Transmembrane protein 184C n=1 Tax=Papilio xuthus TaxID=66420 RepID=A0AAJ6ZM93_PAPXU|nr:PREDICTED: transmembrane protein 184C [Papilio xuthus]
MCSPSILSFFSQWRLWIRPFFIALYFILVIILVPLLVIHSINNGFTKSDQGSLVAGGFVLMALPISIWQITQHIVHYTKPSLQKHIIRILWMVPIYALNAWIGLEFPEQSIYMDSLRECYEAYVIYNFMIYLLNYLNDGQELEAVLETKPQVYHIFPLCCLTPWEMGSEFVHNCKHGILQYTLVRPLTTVISMICELCGVYGESDFSSNVAFPYIIAINNLSQFVAMYCLVLFYRANREELKPMKPIGKFLCIKAVVFFSFFQGVIINILVFCGVISTIFDISDQDKIKVISSKLQDFLICIEMFLAAIAHHYSFSYKPFVSPFDPDRSCLGSFLAMWDVSDVKRDITEHLGVVGSTFSRRLRGKSMYHMARGYDESSRLVTEPVPSSSAPNLTMDTEPPNVDIRSTTYGSIENTVTTGSLNSETEPLLDITEDTNRIDPKV